MSVSQFYRSVRHIPPSRLWSRLWLTLRRKFTLSPLGFFVRVRRNDLLPVADELPPPIFAPRQHLVVERNGQPFLFQLNRLYGLGGEIDWDLKNQEKSTHLERLAFHYLEFLESLEVDRAESIVLDWIAKTPPWQAGYWLDTWNSYAVSIRSVCMMQWLATNRQHLSDQSFDRVAASIVEQIRFLRRNLEVDIRGNHLIKNIKALLWAGRFFNCAESREWFRAGRDLLSIELAAQFIVLESKGVPDGMHFELSPAYHCQVFADLLECQHVLSDDPSACSKLLALARRPLIDLTHPDGRVSLFNDGGLHMAYSPTECLAVFDRQETAERDNVTERNTSLTASTNPRRTFGFEHCGYYGARFDRTYVLFDCGPSCADELPAHGHGDILAFEWDVDGNRVVVDAGVKEYETGPEREWNRSTRAHNTVTVGDRNQCEFIKSFRVGLRAHGACEKAILESDSISVTGCYTSRDVDGQVVEHTRNLSADELSLIVKDQLSSKKSELAVARLLLNHECTVHAHVENCVRIGIGDARIRLEATSPINIRRAKWSPDFGAEFETNQLEIVYGKTPCEGGFKLTVETE